MKLSKARAIVLILPLLLLFVSCGANPNPTINKQTTSLQLLTRVNEFQDVLSDLYAAKGVSPEHVLVYEKFVVATTHTLQTLPTGWQATVKKSWSELKVAVPMDKMEPRIQITAKLIDAMVGAL